MRKKLNLEKKRSSCPKKILHGFQQHTRWNFHRIFKGNYFGDTRTREVEGIATYRLFDTNPYQLLYREEGILSFEGQTNTLEVYQEYLYHFENSEGIYVYFLHSEHGQKVTGGLFHQIVLTEEDTHHIKGEGFHLCAKDEYKTDYLFEINENQLEKFHLNHQVKGPQKDYMANTIFLKENQELQLTRRLSY